MPRTRRLQDDEEARLLHHASPELKDIIIAAIDTGMRRRELLSLQWQHVPYDAKHQPKAIMLAAEKTKTGRPRTIPLMSVRLKAVLVRQRLGPNGKKLGSSAHVLATRSAKP